MAISKIKGTIEEKTFSDHAIIRVWAFKEGNSFYYEEVDILEEFNDDYFIFSPKFFVRHSNFKIGDLVEIFVSNNGIDYKDNTSSYPSVKDTNCVSTGFRLIELPLNAFIAENSLNLDALSFDINTLSDIYFHSEDFLFGPFKKENQGIKPKAGKEVGRFQYTDGIIIPSEDKLYILNAPTQNTKICDVDCMINDQIVDFLRTKLANISSIDFNSLRRQFSTIQLNGLEQERLTKAQKYLSELELNYTIIKNLIEKNTDFKQIFEKAIENNKEEIKAEYKAKEIQPLIILKEQINKEIESKKSEKEKADNQLNKSKKELKPLQEQFEFLEKEKERLIQDIKVHALIQPQTPDIQTIQNERFYTFEIQDFSKKVTSFDTVNDFRREIRGIVEDNLAVRCFDLLKDYKCLLANDITMVLALAKATNNCKVLIQQVEPDWLKFEHFYENGLKQIWQSAHQEPNKIHFLLLQDLNMASIECYGKPLLDLVAKIRQALPIQNTPFPKNLWIFGFPITIDEYDNFGLPLIKKTFKYWGGLPKIEDGNTTNEIDSNSKLSVEQISEYDNIPSNNINDYFE